MGDGRSARAPVLVVLAVVVAVATGTAGVGPAGAEPSPPSWTAEALRVELPAGEVVEVGGRSYLDTIELQARGDALGLVNELGVEDYVAGIAEMPARWPAAALEAQAIAARTYAWYVARQGSFAGYDICATVACQVFTGADRVREDALGLRWQAAVDATAGQVLLDADGDPILARYFSTSGGRTYANEEAFPSSGPRPELVAIDDPYDEVSPYHRWTVRFTREELDALAARGDTLRAAVPVAAVERLGPADDPGAQIRVTGADGTAVEVGARDLTRFLNRVAPDAYPDRFPGLRDDGARLLPSTVPSSRFRPELTADELVLHGQGWGHGVGMGQYGALGRAEAGYDAAEILAAYYAGTRPTTSSELPARLRVGIDLGTDVALRPAAPARVVVDGEVVTERGLGEWRVERSAEGLTLTPPDGWDRAAALSPTRIAADLAFDDAVVVEADVDAAMLLHLEVTGPDDRVVLRRELGAAEPGTHAATWRFEDEQGQAVPPGSYRLVLAGEDALGPRPGQPVHYELGADQGAPPVPGVPNLPAVARSGMVIWLTAGAALLLTLTVVVARHERRRP